ncbi:Band 4.1-like protein 4A [Tupaia chinensis]|uniref:Band 4.1-like protein 4A n=1 Tax=Tupaia chinensis TaxID=246437 RepID=L9KY16_TUPCH|nr:Band 4.1-like protein 4A [Tupaia chinensis]
MSRDLSVQLPRPDQSVARSRSKTYPKRAAQSQPAGFHSAVPGCRVQMFVNAAVSVSVISMRALCPKFTERHCEVTLALSGVIRGPKGFRGKGGSLCYGHIRQAQPLLALLARTGLSTELVRSAPGGLARLNSVNQITANVENGDHEGTAKVLAPSPMKSGLYNSPNDRTKSPKFPYTRRRNPSCGSDDSVQPVRRRKAHNSGEDSDLKQRRRSRSRCNTSSGSESENSHREHRKKRNRKELVDPAGLSEEQLKEIPYTKIETQGDPIRIRHSHSPRSYRQCRRSQCSDGERSVLSEVNSKTDLVPPLPVTRSSDAQGSGGSTVHQVELKQQKRLFSIHGPDAYTRDVFAIFT